MKQSFIDFAKYLAEPCETDLEKVRSFYRWLTSVDLSHLEATVSAHGVPPEENTPLEYLLKIHMDAGSHAQLFAALCR